MASLQFRFTWSDFMLRMLLISSACILCGCAAVSTREGERFRNVTPETTVTVNIHAAKLCFEPLSQPTSRKRSEWNDLEEYDVSKIDGGDDVKRILSLKDGYLDDFNLDYFALTFTPPAGKKVDDVFAEMRKEFSVYAAWDSGKNAFRGFAKEQRNTADATRVKNEALWATPEHKGAVMTFLLKGITLAQSNRDSRLALKRIHGDVLSICASPTDFIFATVETDQIHPVAGLRGFGLKDDKNGNWTFYSKAADRITSTLTNKLIWNATTIDTFKEGRDFWAGFYGKMRSRLIEQGFTVPASVIENCNVAKWKGDTMKPCAPL